MANIFDQFDEESENVFDQFDPEAEQPGISLLEREKEIPGGPVQVEEEITQPLAPTSNVQSTLIRPSDGTGKKETVYFEESREEITVPAGGSSVLHDIMQDAAFDDTADDPDSTVLEETLATLEKQAAYLALLANAYGFVDDEDIDDFIADRSRALSNAQKHAPAYMTGFQSQYAEAEGFYEHAGVILSNPRAIGRLIVTQAPNSIIPLLTGLLGAVGGPVGFLGGTFAGGSIVEIGAWMDQEIQRRGVDMGDREQVLAVLQDDAFMTAITREAERKGLSTAAVDTLFAAFGGRLMRKAIKGTSTFSKVGRGAGLVATETVGEATGEAAGAAVVGKLDIPDAVLEGIAGFGQSVGQAGIGLTLAKGREAVAGKAEEAPVTEPVVEEVPAEEGIVTETEKLERAVEEIKEEEAVPEVEDITPETTAKVVEEIDTITTEIVETPPEGVSAEELETDGSERIEKALEAIGPTQKTRETLIKGRITKLESDREALNKQLDGLETLRGKTAKPSESLKNKIQKLEDDLALLDVELDNMIILGLANDLKVSKKVSAIERKREAKETEKKIQINEAELILEELEQGNEPERQFRRDEEGFLEEVFQVRSTNPPFLFGDLDTVGLTQGGKKPNRRSKRSVINAVKRVINGKPAPEQPAQAALHQRILDIIEDRVSGELPRFQPGSGFEDPIRANAAQSIAELQAEEGITTIQDLFNALEDKDVLRETEIDVAQPIQITGEKLVKLEQESLRAQERALKQGLREGARLAKTNIKQARRNIRDLINASALSAADKKSILALAEFDTVEDIVKSLPKLQTRIAVAFDRTQRKRLLSEIKKVVKRVKKAKNISIDAVRAVEALVKDIEFGKQSEQDRQRLQRAFLNLSDLPAAIINKLETLSKTSVEDLSNQDLQELLNQINKIAELGKVKLRTRKEIKKLQRERNLRVIKVDAKKIEDSPQITSQGKGVGESLQRNEQITNVFRSAYNVGKRKLLALTPMDTVFNMLSKTGNFRGAVTEIFKKPVDKDFQAYNRNKIIAQDKIEKAVEELEINESSRERIAVFAELRQEGGKEKLIATGYKEEALDKFSEEGLTENETKLLDIITDELEVLRPQVLRVLKAVDNKDFTTIKDFFPMMTDFEAMENNEIKDRFGKDADLLEGTVVDSNALKKNVVLSSTFERTGAPVPIHVDAVDVAFKHIDNALYYIHLAEDLKDLGELARTDEYGASVGNIGQEVTREWIDLLARKGRAQGTRSPVLDALRRNTAWAVLGYKLSSALIQPTALIDGAIVLGPWAFKGARNILNAEWRSFIQNNFIEIKLRTGDDIAFADIMKSGKGSPIVTAIAGKAAGKGVALTRKHSITALRTLDSITASAIAAGAYEKIVTEKGDVVDFNNPDQEAIAEAELIVRRTQSSGDFRNVPSATTMGKFTGNVSIDKLLFQFQSFMLTRFALVTNLVSEQGLRPTLAHLNLLSWFTLALIAEEVIRRSVQELLAVDGDEDDELFEGFATKIGMQYLNSIPFVGQIASSFNYGNASVPAINMLNRGLRNFNIAINSKSSKYKRGTMAIMILAGEIGGVPGALQVEQIIRDVWKVGKSKNDSAAAIERLTQ